MGTPSRLGASAGSPRRSRYDRPTERRWSEAVQDPEAGWGAGEAERDHHVEGVSVRDALAGERGADDEVVLVDGDAQVPVAGAGPPGTGVEVVSGGRRAPVSVL